VLEISCFYRNEAPALQTLRLIARQPWRHCVTSLRSAHWLASSQYHIRTRRNCRICRCRRRCCCQSSIVIYTVCWCEAFHPTAVRILFQWRQRAKYQWKDVRFPVISPLRVVRGCPVTKCFGCIIRHENRHSCLCWLYRREQRLNTDGFRSEYIFQGKILEIYLYPQNCHASYLKGAFLTDIMGYDRPKLYLKIYTAKMKSWVRHWSWRLWFVCYLRMSSVGKSIEISVVMFYRYFLHWTRREYLVDCFVRWIWTKSTQTSQTVLYSLRKHCRLKTKICLRAKW